MLLPWAALSRCLKSRLRRGEAERLNFGEERFERDRITEVMGIGIIERVYVPSHLGVVLAIDTMVFSDESESSFLSRDVVEYLDERTIHAVSGQPTIHVLQASSLGDQGFPFQVIPFGLPMVVLIAVLGLPALAVLVKGHPVLCLESAQVCLYLA